MEAFLFEPLHQRGLEPYELGHPPVAPRTPGVGRHGLEDACIVEAEILRVVIPLREGDTGLREHVAEALVMEGLAVGDDAVEVEHNRPKQAAAYYPFPSTFSRSPARIGTLRRFSGGGKGQS